jgi:hypothetical protein
LYNEKTLIGRLYRYFSAYFETFSAPTADTLFLLVLSILALESAHSIRFLYRHFLSAITGKSLNAFYFACSYAKADYSRFMNTTARIALHLIPDNLTTQPIFLCIDDTALPKSGTNCLCHFCREREYSKASLFQHRVSGRTTDFLRMAGKRTFKPYRK